MLEIAYGNVRQEDADRLERACGPAPDGVEHEPGGAEPWVSRLVADFVVAIGARTVLETGCFKGATSVHLFDALRRLGGGVLHLCELEKDRMKATADRLIPLSVHDAVHVDLHHGDVLAYLTHTPSRFDLAWVDDNHERKHVERELQLLFPKMSQGGLILLHDVYGSCDLRTVVTKFGGYSIDLPRLGPAGGIGIIQVAR